MRPHAAAREAFSRRASVPLEALDVALSRGGAHDVAVVVPAPLAAVESWLSLETDAPCVVWKDGVTGFAGLGAARGVMLRGAMTDVDRAEIARLCDGVAVEDLSGSFVSPVRAAGGLAFDAARPVSAPWEHHGAGRFVLPRWSYVRDAEHAWLVVVGTPEDRQSPDARRTIVEQTARWLDFLDASDVPNADRVALVEARGDADDEWLRRVGAARELVVSGRCRKVVAARRRHHVADAELRPYRVVATLAASQPGCLVYAFRFGGTCFVGATPETLVEQTGRFVRCDALAGSAAAGCEDELLASEKDRQEHAWVVGDVAARLAGVCERVTCSARPGIRRLRDVVHLHTPIEGVLRSDGHVLELVSLLHPTPAVAGAPREAAMRWIAGEEGASRGWYAGPIGWCDAAGDGRFAVALRSAVLRARDVWTFAGAGIVAASDPPRELAEVRWKERAVLRALGAET